MHVKTSFISHFQHTNEATTTLYILQVSEMKAEYFPPKEDVILQNEAPTDFYILVNGTADLVDVDTGTESVSRVT
jgi:signal-transduction protein with cAMP-binding, CBS, and nucleotidyltransferase domain